MGRLIHMGNVTIYHIVGRNEYVVATNDGRERRNLNKHEAKRLSEKRGWPIQKTSPEDWDLTLKTWSATDAAHHLEPSLAATPEQAMEAVQALFAKGATMLSIRAIQANPVDRKKQVLASLNAAVEKAREQDPTIRVIDSSTPEEPAEPQPLEQETPAST